MSGIPRVDAGVADTDTLSAVRSLGFVLCTFLAGSLWLFSMNYVEVVLPDQLVLGLFFGGLGLVPLVSGGIAAYRCRRPTTGLLLGSAFPIGGMWIFWDHTVAWTENVLMMVVLGGVVGVAFGCVGAAIGRGGRWLRSPDEDGVRET